MSTALWGELEEKPDIDNKICMPNAKKIKIDELMQRPIYADSKRNTLKVKNPLVTQTIEVMKQTEMLQSLIDTYSNKSGTSNYLLNPCQMIPEIDFPPENAADLVSEEKFQKPIWFIPTLNTPFSRGDPQSYAQISNSVCRASFRKSICGQMRVAGFTDTAESALILFADAIEQFMQSFVHNLHDTDRDPGLEERDLQIAHVEKAYFQLTDQTITHLHNYYKHHLITRNRIEIAEFNAARQEYDKLMKESQNMQKSEFPENDLLNILEMPPETNDSNAITMTDMLQELGNGNASSASNMTTTMSSTSGNNICANTAILTLLDGSGGASQTSLQNNGYLNNFE